LEKILFKNQHSFCPVVAFDPHKDRLLKMNLTTSNRDLNPELLNDTNLFSDYVYTRLKNAGARYGIGGYGEHRAIYSRSVVFNDAHDGEPRRFHLGTDIWGPAGTEVFAPIAGVVHSFAFNNAYGDYGATIILAHQLEDFRFHTLYGHLSLLDLDRLTKGKMITKGDKVAHFGPPQENGQWPPHLHFQIILQIGEYMGDYPGVCKYSERNEYLENCPDPDIILQLNRYL
jgi:murein DD-endopeptidase MepM/ murein hydrolase activator NlpD